MATITLQEHQRLLRIEKAVLAWVSRTTLIEPTDADVARLREVEEKVIDYVDGESAQDELDTPELRELRISVGRTPRLPAR